MELFFDLAFVVAVASAASELHHAIAEDHVVTGLVGFAVVFFAIWWAWVNFTWFASAYDTDDVPYRLLTMVQMTGVVVFAAGVPAGLGELDFTVMTLGYVVMRVALIAQWLRAAGGDPDGRPAALRYAVGVGVVQIGWLLRLALASPWDGVVLVVLIAAELLVPVWAEYRGAETTWHPDHIAERYGLFTIIVLGEVVLGVAALGAGLEVAVDAAAHHEVSPVAAAWSVAVPVAVYLVVLMRLDRRGEAADPSQPLVFGGALLVLITAGVVGVLGIGVAVLIMGAILAALVTATVALADRRDVAPTVAATDAPVDPS